MKKAGGDPLKNSIVEFDATPEYWTIRENKNGHMDDLIGQIQA